MRIELLGDMAVVLSELPESAPVVAAALEASGWPGLLDAVACNDMVGVYFDASFDRTRLEQPLPSVTAGAQIHLHGIPILYQGTDLRACADRLERSVDEFVRLHAAAEYSCFAVGFCPGFAYLGPVPEALRGIARLPSPRVRTEAGSLGITGNQTAVYPLPRPGGWPIIGRTPLTLVDVDDDYFPIRAGDRVRFRIIDEAEFARLRGERL